MTKKQKLLILFILSSAIVISLAFFSGPFLATKLGGKDNGDIAIPAGLALWLALGKSWKKIAVAVLGVRQKQGNELASWVFFGFDILRNIFM